ncbi:unnamed protein product [Leptosia nina]|uniref:Aquaporin n=1 Tax=Leptosia nina TaxID=320188 RepID=A0AAV1J188_9NEOP
MANFSFGFDERDYKTLLQQLFAEFIGTFLYLSIALLAGTFDTSLVTVALANGLLVASVVQIIGSISGGHINPAVTLGVLVYGDIKPVKAVLYIVVQILGAILGSAVAYALTESEFRGNLGAIVPGVVRVDQAFGLEVLMTLVLVAVVISVNRKNRRSGSSALTVGLSITACQCSAMFYTGSLSPVRSLGPAVLMNIWTHHWVYWVGPMLGGVLAGVTCRYLFKINVQNDEA